MKRILAVALAALAPLAATTPADAARSYQNCDALHGDYPHGVARAGARDRVRGSTRPVTNFKVNTRVYRANTRLDRDKDGVACESR